MQDLVLSILEQLIDFRYHFWELDKSQPLWCWIGIRWCLRWLDFHGDIHGDIKE